MKKIGILLVTTFIGITSGMLSIEIDPETKQTVYFDLCKVIECGNDEAAWRRHDVYGCLWPSNEKPSAPFCHSWKFDVHWYTQPGWVPQSPFFSKATKSIERYKFIRSMTFRRGVGVNGAGINPIVIGIPPSKKWLPMWITIGVDLTGKDPKGVLEIKAKKVRVGESLAEKVEKLKDDKEAVVAFIATDELINEEEQWAMETGYQEENKWLDWARYTARQVGATECFVCAGARPRLATVPIQDRNWTCMVSLFNKEIAGCEEYEREFPPTDRAIPPGVQVHKGNYTCFRNEENLGVNRGTFEKGWCKDTILITDTIWARELANQNRYRADIWWLCGDRKLRSKLRGSWKGECTLVRLIMPFTIIKTMEQENKHRHKRDAPGGAFDNRVWIDGVGVPRGVPDEFKARDQIAAGFESIIFWWSTLNKNVDWINYLYYNQQRFVNFTIDAVEGIKHQLGNTSLMTLQNRIALDMLLAERGGVCSLIGSGCCTWIPNNTAPDGSITRALNGLKSLQKELAENSGIDNPFNSWMTKWFGQYSALITSLLMSIAVAAAILVTCGCCCIPCIRSLCNRWIVKTVEGKDSPPYQMPLLGAVGLNEEEPKEEESEVDLL
nr:uncharacterized protein LOC129445867 [Misgurnus anguillicaudatus]